MDTPLGHRPAWQDDRVNQPPRPTRRQLLAGVAVVAVAAAGGCTGRAAAPPPPDPLRPLLAAALADAELAEAVAAAHPSVAGAALALAADRRSHAEAIGAEVLRVTPSPAPASTTSVPADPSVPPEPAAATGALVAAVRAAQTQAGALVAGLPRHRAGLAASVAACCASHVVVLG